MEYKPNVAVIVELAKPLLYFARKIFVGICWIENGPKVKILLATLLVSLFILFDRLHKTLPYYSPLKLNSRAIIYE